ncbi:MAG TPA: type II CAAX endopeptidase family protein [Cyclobacteriaceae bacterium]|nr:type II CAAX endopeptidase family protein [Cyclobacteriaceae bacterium]
MAGRLSHIFFTTTHNVRSIWWVVIFFLILFLLLFPIIFLAEYYGFEITFWLQAILILAVSILCQALRRNPLNELTGKINPSWFRELFIGLAIGAVLMILPALLLTLFGTIHWQVNEVSLTAVSSGIIVMMGVVLAEELLFRGFIFHRLIESFGQWPAQLLLAGMFLLTHLNNPGMTGTIKIIASINIFIASILFGISYIKTKNLAMPIGLHFMANVVQGTLLGFGVSGEQQSSLFTPVFGNTPTWITGGSFGLEASIVGLLTLVIITGFLYFRYPQKELINHQS